MSNINGCFKHESLQDRFSITKYFNAISKGFYKSALALYTNNKCLLLKPNGLILLELEAKRKNGQAKLNLQFCWKEQNREKKK